MANNCENEIEKRVTNRIVGVFQKSRNFGFVIPDDRKLSEDIFIPKEYCLDAVDGHKVVVDITSHGGDGKKPEGKITEILGHINDPGVDIMSIIKGFDLPTEFPERVLNRAAKIKDTVSPADMEGREDLRDWQMVTIDGEDTKDIDDAVSLTRDGDDYILGVHIADVSNYVQYRSALDREAYLRGTSVYLADRVIPMLPHKLSNGICSLNAGEDRLTLSCIMRINPQGKVTDYRIVESVINVDRRMDYTTVNRIISDRDESLREEYRDFVSMFDDMAILNQILRDVRKKRGAIDFDFKETTMELDESGRPIDIKPYDRNDATKLIESFMLLARILDIGTGTGILTLMMAQRFPDAKLTAIEIDENAVIDATANFSNSPWNDRITLHHIALQDYTPQHKFDAIVCNPPYFDKSLECPGIRRLRARHTSSLPFGTLVDKVMKC